MTIGTALAFIVTGIFVLVAIVGGIWLEQRMPDLTHQHITAGSPEPALPSEPAAPRLPGPVASSGVRPAHPAPVTFPRRG